MKKVFDVIDYGIETVNERIRKISESVYNKIINNENFKYLETKKYYDRVKPFVDKMAEIRKNNPELYKRFMVIWNWKDANNLSAFLVENNLVKEFAEVKQVLDELYNRQLDTGIALPYSQFYLPTQVKDIEGLMTAIEDDLGIAISGDIDHQAYHLGLTKGTPE
jgi:hypothetical protein